MKKKFLLLLFLVFTTVFVYKLLQNGGNNSSAIEKNKGKSEKQNNYKNHPQLDRGIKKIIITRHARCRMQCRQVDEWEVKEILADGTINYNKSRPSKKGGYEFALEGNSRDNQNLRIVFAQENNQLTVITCIDLDTDWPCDCPGDEHKN